MGLVLLSACQSVPKSDRPITLQYSTWGSAEETKVLKGLLQEFEETHPTIHIELLHIPDQYYQKLHILIAGGLTPDVMFTNTLYLPVYASQGIFADLTPYLAKTPDLKEKDFFPQALKACQWQTDPKHPQVILAAVPRDISDLVIYYNQDLFQQAGLGEPDPNWNWDGFLKTAQALTVDQNHDGHPEQFGIGFNRTPPLMWLPYVWSQGGALFDPAFDKMTLAKTPGLEALAFYASWRNQYHIAPRQIESGQATMSQLFLQQKIAMMVSGRWSVPVFREQATFQWDVAPLPKGKAGSKVGIDASGFAMATTTPHPQEAWELIAFLASAHASEAFTQSGLIVPARKDVAASKSFLNESLPPHHNRVFIDIVDSGVPTHTPPRWNEISELLGVTLDPVWDGKKTPEAALAPIQAQIEALLPGKDGRR